MLISANIFQPLISVFEAVLKFFHHSLGVPWGWAIVLLTIAVRAVLIPLTFKQFHSMQRMQQHMPELKAIQAKYKDDKERQQQEMMKFYKENQINPFGSCLPLVAQFPVFISLYYMLRQSLRADICPEKQPGATFQNGHWVVPHAANTVACGPHGGASFLFIPDLTDKATGWVLIVLIVLYVGSQLASSVMMASATMDRNQRLLLMFMPVVFVFIIIRFPAGVLVYWITTNVWTMLQQYIVRRRIGPVTPATATGPSAAVDGTAREAGAARRAPTRAPAAVQPATPAAGSGSARGNGGARGGGDGVDGGNGNGGLGGLSGLLRGRQKPAKEPGGREPAAVGSGSGQRTRTEAPPPPPRKKKKRSGRRR